MKYDMEKLVKGMDFSSNNLNEVNGFLLSNKEIRVLDEYNIDYLKCNSLKDVLFRIEEVLNDMDIVDEELDYVSSTIQERDYYQNSHK